MDGSKWWLDSQTVQGVLLTFVPTIIGILHAFGFAVGSGEIEIIVNGIAGIMGAIGATIAIVGRFNANSKISLEKPIE